MTNNNRIELYLIRHAETVMNTNRHLIGGRSNETPLTPRGIEQAKSLGRNMLTKKIIPKDVFSSPAIRTQDTARYSLAEMGLDAQPKIADEIQELGQGIWEGKPRVEAYSPEVMEKIAKEGKDFRLEGGESMNDVGRRMHRWISETFAPITTDETQRYFVYTHGGAIRFLAAWIEDWDHLKSFATEIDNTSVNLFTSQGEDWTVEYLNRPSEAI